MKDLSRRIQVEMCAKEGLQAGAARRCQVRFEGRKRKKYSAAMVA